MEEYGAGILNVSVNDIIGHIEAAHGKLTSEQKRKVDKLAKSYSKKKFKESEKVVKPAAPLRPASPVRIAPVALPTHIRFASPTTRKHTKFTESPKKINVGSPTIQPSDRKFFGPTGNVRTLFADGPTKINVRSPTIKTPDRKLFGPTGNVRTLFADGPTKINTTNLFGESPLLAVEKKRSKSKRKV